MATKTGFTVVFCPEKLWGTFTLQKVLTLFLQKRKYLCIQYFWNFNVLITNNIISFKHLGPGCSKHRQLNELVRRVNSLSDLQVYNQIHWYFWLKKWEKLLHCTAKASHIFSTKNIGIFEMLTFEILTPR